MPRCIILNARVGAASRHRAALGGSGTIDFATSTLYLRKLPKQERGLFRAFLAGGLWNGKNNCKVGNTHDG
eukprot:4041786-Alexandrium_andersonii.AAC.1